MKIVKLNRNFKIHRVHGFAVGLKFDYYGFRVAKAENACYDRFGPDASYWKYTTTPVTGDWAKAFGRRWVGSTPYWIYLRDETMLTMLMLTDDFVELA